MPLTLSRRALLAGAAASLSAPASFAQTTAPDSAFEKRITAIEKREGGRFGVAAFDSNSGRRLAYRGGERFPLCSTFKFLAAAAILAQVDQGKETLDRRVAYKKSDLVVYSPVTEKHVSEGGMTVGALCAAAVQLSDNTAGNLLLAALGGPAGLTQYCRSLGDSVTRLDRIEPFLNDVPPGDERDTTAPAAMVGPYGAAASRRCAYPRLARATRWLDGWDHDGRETPACRACRRAGASGIRPAPGSAAPPTMSPSCGRRTVRPC